MRERRVIISGGGTGGHIFPALAVGQGLRKKDAGLRLVYIGSSRPLEKKIMEDHSVEFIPLKIEGIKGRGLKAARSWLLLPFSFLKSLVLILRLRPALVIGMGGFSSGPVVLLASWLRIPTVILEQNLRPGFTNRLLRRWARKAVVAFPNSLPYFRGKGVMLGNPVREEFYGLRPKRREDKLTLLVFGGSQGSRFLNQTVAAALPHLRAVRGGLRIFHQTGEADAEWVAAAYRSHQFPDAVAAPFFPDMARYFEMSDFVICRAGATTIAELIAAKKPSLLIPFAQAADDHQTANAGELERLGAAEVLPEKEATPERLAGRIIFIGQHASELARMENNLLRLRTEGAADKIAALCLELMEDKA